MRLQLPLFSTDAQLNSPAAFPVAVIWGFASCPAGGGYTVSVWVIRGRGNAGGWPQGSRACWSPGEERLGLADYGSPRRERPVHRDRAAAFNIADGMVIGELPRRRRAIESASS